MQGNIEEEEKCSEKLTQMQKYLPFIDFMIDKIQKRNNEKSLECQLSKFQLLRSVISEKRGKYSWDDLVKIEDVIERLISKLDFKEQYEKPKEHLAKNTNTLHDTNMATSLSMVSSSTTSVSVTTTSSTQATSVQAKNPEFSTRTVDLIMKTLKISVDSSMNKCTERGAGLSSPLGTNQSHDVPGDAMETDLDKDLDGFDLVDCSNLSEPEVNNGATEPADVIPEKPFSGDDLLSSSREKLLKSLQSRLFPAKTQSDLSAGNKSDKANESHCTSVFNRSQINVGERKSKSDFTDSIEHKTIEKNRKDVPIKIYDKKFNVTPDPLKFVSSIEKTRTDFTNNSGDVNFKQKLKEKLSTVINEVYRVPGKSVGGSLRSLKETKDRRKSVIMEEDDLFKPDKITETKVTRCSNISQSRSSTETKNHDNKYYRDSSSDQKKGEKNSEKTSYKSYSSTSGKHDKKRDNKNPKNSSSCSRRNESSKNVKTREKKSDSSSAREKKSFSSTEEKNFDLEKLNDDELLRFVKENMQSLPHLSKLKPEELRKAVRSSFCNDFYALDIDAVSEISDDSLQDVDDVWDEKKKHEDFKSEINVDSQKTSTDKDKSEEPHFLASVIISKVGSDGVAKNVKPIVEPSKDTIVLEEIGDKTHDMDDDAFDENQDEEDYAMKLIEETTPNTNIHKRKKGLLELPMPITDDLFDEISSIESFETSISPTDKRDSRLGKLPSENEREPSDTKSESSPQVYSELSNITKEVRSCLSSPANPLLPKDTSHGSKPQSAFGPLSAPTDNHKTQLTNQERERSDPRLVKSVTCQNSKEGNQTSHFANKYAVEPDSTFRNSKLTVYPAHVSDQRRHSYLSSEPKSYAEYKRRKLKEQEKIRHQEQTSQESQKNTLSDNSNKLSIPLSPVGKEDASKKTQNSRHLNDRHRDRKRNHPKSYKPSHIYDAKSRRHTDNVERKEKKNHLEEVRKEADEIKHLLESEELVSPLEKLYRNERKPKTGRGYGIQNFKIPKKVQKPVSQKCFVSNTSTLPNSIKQKRKTRVSNAQSVITPAKRTQDSEIIEMILDAQDEIKSTEESTDVNNVMKESEKEKNESSAVNISESDSKVEQSDKSSEWTKPCILTQIDSTVSKNVFSDSKKAESSVECAKTDINVVGINSEVGDSVEKSTNAKDDPVSSVSESIITLDHTKDTSELEELAKVESKTDLSNDKTDAAEQLLSSKNDGEKEIVTTTQFKKGIERLKKCAAEVVECDSSVESSPMNEQNSGKDCTTPSDKSTILSKEEITQEFVEALIRKSFQSGEGKLLLAQVKLFEEFARKLNSKKLKTIQKIINSESGSSSSISGSSSEDEKKKKKSKKAEEKSQKTKKRKKKIKSRRKRKLSSSSSSSSESEDSSDEENCNKKETKSSEKSSVCEGADREEGKLPQTSFTFEEKSKNNESSAVLKSKNKKRRRRLEFGRNFGGNRTKRKQKQKKLLEKILNESPQPEGINDSIAENPGDLPAKESESKNKPRRGKTELDRLHEDIRRMFICEGVVTATGQRMCRILKQSGGNMNNLDIVKESAKMVEEEKLKKVQTRSSSRNSRASNAGSSESRSSSSQSIDKEKIRDSFQENEEEDTKLALEPRVALHRVDLDNFGYGVKLSDDCVSFRRVRGRNTALRGTGTRRITSFNRPTVSIPMRKVFLARNRRKYERMRDSKCKISYVRKKLTDIIIKLPLKMAKMKHLQICEKKPENDGTKKKQDPSKKLTDNTLNPKYIQKSMFSRLELLHYAFERKRKSYPCKLCPRVTQHITGHYKTTHPEHEVLISRLCLQEARKAKLDSRKNGHYESMSSQNSLAESMKKKVQALMSRSYKYNCRMCSACKITDINNFASHISSHTGEYRFQCPVEGCALRTFSIDDIKFHILTKHPKNKLECYSKIIELYPLSTDGCQMFGYLCSKCHYVQICRSNLEKHVSGEHEEVENVKIIKINMSSKRLRSCKKKVGNSKNDSQDGSENEEIRIEKGQEEKEVEETEKVFVKLGNDRIPSFENAIGAENAKNTKNIVEGKSRKRRKVSPKSGYQSGSDVGSPDSKKLLLDETVEDEEVIENPVDSESDKELVDPLLQEIDVEEDNTQENNLGGELVIDDGVDLKNVSSLQKSDDTDSAEKKESPGKNQTEATETCTKLKVGPLEAQLLENSEIMYECYVKGCLFVTRVFDLFEIHIKISHWKVRWNGICEICGNGKNDEAPRKNTLQLLTALKHLKLHEKEKTSGGKLTPDDLVRELNLLNRAGKSIEDDNESNKAELEYKHESEALEEKLNENNQSSETPFPVKPLLRVRNFFGDRLSTPKTDENDLVSVSEETCNIDETSDNSSTMFTIENVRSLSEISSEPSELKIDQVCSLKDQIPQSVPQLGSQKTIMVRSCPSRNIPILPKPSSTLAVDVGQINMVQSLGVRPVVLSPVTNTSPFRILSAALASKSFPVKPSPGFGETVVSPNVLPAIYSSKSPVVSPTASTPTVLPGARSSESTSLPNKTSSHESSTESAQTSDVEMITSPTRSKSPLPTITIHHYSKNSSDTEDTDEKNAITNRRMYYSPISRKKSLKDAKIYHEMLTKTKLCHLFKCMGIECSFTCNDQNVFTQHIGLHEAQRRLKKAKGLKTFYIRLANKLRKAFYWQQCAYCCEVLSGASNALSQHILTEHGHCMYQCAFCFYRAFALRYVEIHQNSAHSQTLKSAPRVIYKCKPLTVAPTQVAALEKHGRKRSVRPYHCDQCGRKFYMTHEFMNHLTSKHQSVTAYTCHICKNLCFKVNRLINHYKLHFYSTYQCAYCLHGTETEMEMMFHLCNFHFSQPAVMYVRALAEGQSEEEKQRPNKKKKALNNQLDSLKVISYECDALDLDCVVKVDPEEETPGNNSDASLDISAIVAELGINTDSNSSAGPVIPLMQELASISDKSAKKLTVKCLLPNAEFSSENESGNDNCSVLISSGLRAPCDNTDEKEMDIPLGQLPLETVNVHHKESSSLPRNIDSPDKNLKLCEIIANFQQKKALALNAAEDETPGQPQSVMFSAAVHKLPPVVLTRSSVSKGPYPLKSIAVRKKSVDQCQDNSNTEKEKLPETLESSGCDNKEKASSSEVIAESAQREGSVEVEKPVSKTVETETSKPVISNVVGLSEGEVENKETPIDTENSSIVISDVCSLSKNPKEAKSNSGILINIQSKLNSPSVLKPPIIRVEDYLIDENTNPTQSSEELPSKPEESSENNEKAEEARCSSPDVIILEEEKTKDIVTVTLDSDDDKEENGTESNNSQVSKPILKGGEIRKEMEILRQQITAETGSLLQDEIETTKPSRDLPLSIQTTSEEVDETPKTLMSPIEEAICSLNKKLQSETKEAQKKKNEEKKKVNESPKKPVSSESPKKPASSESPKKPASTESQVSERPRTRFGSREKKKEGAENAEKSEVDDENRKKEDQGKNKKVRGELTGKELFICGNEKCNFAAETDSSLKDHLYVCDLSRESSMLVCPHCSKQMKQFHPYLEHLKYHGEKKFHCGLCSFSSAVDTSTAKHVRQKHRCSLLKILPKEGREGHLAYYPKNYKVDKVDFEVNGYSPGDEDKLPLQSVYQVNVKCAKCPYFTKVRSNMVRHLKIHVKSVETEGSVVVPSTAPTNPVPCLETKERMFDKMTNLAASSQLAQAREKVAVESLSPEEEAKLPQFVPEQMRYKCCLPDCNYITVDEGMLKHHIKALHDEINYYSCPHCKSSVHIDVRNVTLDKIGNHLKHHDTKLYKCAHCIYFHFQKSVVEKHTVEKHPDRRYFVHTVREPKPEPQAEEECSSSDGGARVWKCGLCDEYKTPFKPTLMDHLLKSHNTKSKYKCQFCSIKGNSYQSFLSHFSSKHPGEKVSYIRMYFSEKVANSLESQSGNSSGADSSNEHFDTTPLWQRGAPRIRHIRGILIEEEEIKTKRSKRISVEESESDASEANKVKDNAFYCPLCTNKKKPFYTRSEDCFRTHLYQELNYQQFACILCGKMFVDKKDFERHHARSHPDKPQSLKQTKEDHEIKFWVDQVIAKRKKQMDERKRKLSDADTSGGPAPPKKKKEG